jgi:hypothetical protein
LSENRNFLRYRKDGRGYLIFYRVLTAVLASAVIGGPPVGGAIAATALAIMQRPSPMVTIPEGEFVPFFQQSRGQRCSQLSCLHALRDAIEFEGELCG